MRVKKYVASSMPEAMKLIRADLGNDAIILNSKMIHTGGFFGFFKKKKIEVIAAIDQVSITELNVKDKHKGLSNLPVKQASFNEQTIPKEQQPAEKSNEEIISELSELKDMIRKISLKDAGGVKLPAPIQYVNDKLLQQEVDNNIRESIISALLEKWFLAGSNQTEEKVLSWCRDLMVNRISKYSYGEISFDKKYVNVIGPTGVGKTTTLAKISADCILKFHKKVALITTDTFRIAAIDQLKTYAKILSVPLEVCYNVADFRRACETFKDYDIVLIDTAGRNFRNRNFVEELKELLEFDNSMETYLVLSLTTKQKDMEEIYDQFSGVDISKFIFTKIDETSNYGAMYNLIEKYKKGVAYITNGQNVPDDRFPASAEIIANMILGVEGK